MDVFTLFVGFIAGALFVGAGTAYMLRKGDRDVPASAKRLVPILAAVMLGLLSASPTFAQATAVPLEIPTDVIFTETNNWIATFAPIAAIGIGITIALAVLAYLGKMIAGAFKG